MYVYELKKFVNQEQRSPCATHELLKQETTLRNKVLCFCKLRGSHLQSMKLAI